MFVCLTATAHAVAQSGIYAAGHFRRNRPVTVETLRLSGYTDVVIFNVTVSETGDLTVDFGREAGGTICTGGKYVFDEVQPYFADDVKALKRQQPTGVQRIELCIGGARNNSYLHIKDLVNQYGVGPETVLYKNFKALLDRLEVVDAVNIDDEYQYDATTAIKFHNMLAELGLHTTIAPYTNISFWRSLVSGINAEHPGYADRIWLQCYDGGARNNPNTWKMDGCIMYCGLTNYGQNVSAGETKFKDWRTNNGVVGGFLWVYNDETWNLNEWAAAINRAFQTKTADQPVATFYQDINYGGYAVQLSEGTYSRPELALYGIKARDITSLKVEPGYKVTLYEDVEPKGDGATYEAVSDVSFLGSDWNDRASAIRIEQVNEPDPEEGVVAPYNIDFESFTNDHIYEGNGLIEDHSFAVGDGWGHIIDTYEGWRGKTYIPYYYRKEGGVNDSHCIYIEQQIDLTDYDTKEKVKTRDALVTPPIKGTVSIAVQKRWNYAFGMIDFYEVEEAGDGTLTLGRQIDVAVPEITTSWQTINFQRPLYSRIAIVGSQVCIDNFHADKAIVDNSTAINVPRTEPQNANAVYNLQGQRTGKPQRGLYIIGGRKLLMK